MPREPGLHLLMLMGGAVVVDDSLNNPAGWHRALDGIEKADERLMAGSSLALWFRAETQKKGDIQSQLMEGKRPCRSPNP